MINIKVCKEAYSDSGRVVQIDNDGTVIVSSVRTSVGMTQTGSGTPSTSNKRPIVRWNDVVTHRSNSEDDAGTEYTTDLGRDGITAFEIDVIKGEVTVTGGLIESYNGETLTGEWISDRDVYVSGGTPSTGAQVAYELAQPYSFAVTPQYINLVDGLNYLWVVINGSTIRDDEYEGESISFTATDTTIIIDFDIDFAPKQDGTPWQSSLMQVPYIFQRTPQLGHDYNSEFVNAIVGGTVAWNQLIDKAYLYSGTQADVSFTPDTTNGTIAISGTASSGTQVSLVVSQHPSLGVAGHKYLVVGCNGINTRLGDSSNYHTTDFIDIGQGPTATRVAVRLYSGSSYNVTLKPQIIDLTALFGSSTIADYLYSLEQTTAGSGIAKLKEWGFLTNDYYAYDAGSLQSVNTSAHETVGKNLLNVLSSVTVGGITFTKNSDGYVTASSVSSDTRYWNYGNAQYKCKLPTGSYKIILEVQTPTTNSSHGVRLIDIGGTLLLDLVDISPKPFSTAGIKSYDFTIDKQTEFGVMTKQYDASVRFMIVRADASSDYEPYVKHSYPLDSDLTLRGIPKLDASNNLYYDGDVYEPSGAVTRKYGIVDLGTLNWIRATSTTYPYFRTASTLSDIKHVSNNSVAFNGICSKYIVTDANTPYLGNATKCICTPTSGDVFVYDDSYTDATVFKTAMSGVYLVYELATPTTETANTQG